jgi:hypothetical protein
MIAHAPRNMIISTPSNEVADTISGKNTAPELLELKSVTQQKGKDFGTS